MPGPARATRGRLRHPLVVKTSITLSVLLLLGGCGPAAPGPSTTPAATADGAQQQQVVTEIPAAAGAVAAAGQLPAEVTSLPPAQAPAADATLAAPAAAPVGPQGTIVGQAWYAGPACGWASWPPRCNGPYRSATVWIWSHQAGTWLRSATADNEGRYTFYVDAGWYTIMFPTGFGQEWWYAKINVPPLETITANLVVDHGER